MRPVVGVAKCESCIDWLGWFGVRFKSHRAPNNVHTMMVLEATYFLTCSTLCSYAHHPYIIYVHADSPNIQETPRPSSLLRLDRLLRDRLPAQITHIRRGRRLPRILLNIERAEHARCGTSKFRCRFHHATLLWVVDCGDVWGGA